MAKHNQNQPTPEESFFQRCQVGDKVDVRWLDLGMFNHDGTCCRDVWPGIVTHKGEIFLWVKTENDDGARPYYMHEVIVPVE